MIKSHYGSKNPGDIGIEFLKYYGKVIIIGSLYDMYIIFIP